MYIYMPLLGFNAVCSTKEGPIKNNEKKGGGGNHPKHPRDRARESQHAGIRRGSYGKQ